MDWIDQDDDERPQGAEEGYYRALTPPYGSRNGPMLFLEELLLVKGMTPEDTVR
jgi:general secretion pathway protein K